MQGKYKYYLQFQKKRSEIAVGYVVREWKSIDLGLK